jgi:ubiquinone/menaquinone biosynthesis C-methylase UbiE
VAGRVLSHQEAKTFYDGFGRKQDLQRFYEDPAIEVLLRYGEFEKATAMVELGCGTGRLAARLLQHRLPAEATYIGFDISPTMIELAQDRVAPWAGRAKVQLTEGSPSLPLEDAAYDLFLSTYVLDLLSEEEIRAVLREAKRVLAPGGRLCLASLTFGQTPVSRLVSHSWNAIHSLHPRLVGGCRPLDLAAFIGPDWQVLHREVVCTFGICTEVLIAASS